MRISSVSNDNERIINFFNVVPSKNYIACGVDTSLIYYIVNSCRKLLIRYFKYFNVLFLNLFLLIAACY